MPILRDGLFCCRKGENFEKIVGAAEHEFPEIIKKERANCVTLQKE